MARILNSLKYRVNRLVKPASAPPASFEEVERAERIFYLNYLRSGMTVFDVGANVGELTLLFSRFAGEVHAFEASGATFARLETICSAAGRRNVRLNHLALSNRIGAIRLNIYPDAYSSFNSQAARPLKDYGEAVEAVGVEEVAATTIDNYCARENIGRIDLLKIDVEGVELQVMEGARRMLESKSVACLAFEFGQATFDMGARAEDIEAFLEKMNYKIRNIVEGAPVFPGRESVESAGLSMHTATPAD